MSDVKQAIDDDNDVAPKVEVMSASESDRNMDDAEAQGWDQAATKKLLRKMDWHLIPFMSLIYLFVSSPSIVPLPVPLLVPLVSCSAKAIPLMLFNIGACFNPYIHRD